MANLEFIVLPDISRGRPLFAVDFLNKESDLLIITPCGEYFRKKCTNANIIERTGYNDSDIFSMIADMKVQVVVLDDCCYDAVDARALLRKVQSLQIKKEFKIILFTQYASLLIHRIDLPKASIVWLPENYRCTSVNLNNLRYYNMETIHI